MVQKTALVIDDEQPILQIVRTVLASFGYATCGASNGTMGLALAKSEKPDIIILDRHMPDMDGNQVLEKLKASKATENIPVIMLTGEKKIDEVKSSIELGARDYVIKPFKAREFIEKVDRIFEDDKNRYYVK